jgi:uroporphyrinogen decarboxylase
MARRDELLRVWKHENIGYIPCHFIDYNFVKPKYVNERPEGKDGYDWFGIHWTYQPDVLAPMITPGSKPIISDITKWKDVVKFPDLDQYDWETYGAEETAGWDRENKISMVMIINGTFERSHHLMGFTEALGNLIEEPEAYGELLDAIADYKCKLIGIIAKNYKPDVIMMHDDYGAAKSMLMSPDTWRQMIKPRLARLVKAAHDNGLFYEHHSCGYIEPIIGDLVEIGVDSLNPLQPCNDLKAIKAKYHGKITFVGGFDSQGVLDNPEAGEAEVRADVKRAYDALAPGGGYCSLAVCIKYHSAPWLLKEHKEIATTY